MSEFNNENEINNEISDETLTNESENTASTSIVKSILREIWEWVYTLVVIFVIVFAVKALVFEVVKVDGSSMYPTLIHNDRLIVTKLGYKPKQGDIVILDSHYKTREKYFDTLAEEQDKEELSAFDKFIEGFDLPEDVEKRYYVKRVIALPGQTIDIHDGKVYIDGEVLDEEYYDGVTSALDSRMAFPQTVEEGNIFVMGDNRPSSLDSRSTSLGQVPYEAVLGKSQVRVWPLNSIGITK